MYIIIGIPKVLNCIPKLPFFRVNLKFHCIPKLHLQMHLQSKFNYFFNVSTAFLYRMLVLSLDSYILFQKVANIQYMHYFCGYKRAKSNMEKIIHVHLIFEKKDYYFGSFAAIYTVLEPSQIGVAYNTLRNARWREISLVQTPRAIIKLGEIIRSERK